FEGLSLEDPPRVAVRIGMHLLGVGGDGPGTHRIHPDAVRPELARERARHPEQRALGGDVRDEVRPLAAERDAADVDDRAAAAPAPRTMSRSWMTTPAPASRRRLAMAEPSPPAPPVIRTARPPMSMATRCGRPSGRSPPDGARWSVRRARRLPTPGCPLTTRRP